MPPFDGIRGVRESFPSVQTLAILPRMWHLKMAGRGEASVTVGSFETVADAARKIIELEGYSAFGVFFEILIEAGPGAASEQSSFGHLEHTGKNTRRCYLVKRIAH